jgi:HK97 family phage prohead protease
MPDAGMTPDDTYEAQLRELCAGLSDEQLAELGDLAEAMHAEAEGRSRFSELSAKLAAHGAHNPDALAAYIGRKKYGREGFAALAKAGRKAHSGHRAAFNEALHPRVPAGGPGGGEFGKASSSGKKAPAEKGAPSRSPFHGGVMAYDPHSNRGPGYGMPHGDPTVKELQRALNRLGLTDAHGRKLAVDGKLGPLTTQAIRAAQRRLGMKETGQVTPAFLAQLQKSHSLPGEKKVTPAHHHVKEAPKSHSSAATKERPKAPAPAQSKLAAGGSGGNKIRSVTVREWATRDFEWESRSAGGDGRTLEGYAAVFGSPTRIADRGGDFDEVIRPGAFARSLERRKPVLQFDHGRDPRVGSVPIGAIQDISEDDHGLYVRARLFDNPVVEPVRQAIAGEAIRGMSFRFRVPDGGDKWTSRQGDVDLREIHDADTAELGPVVFPAYESTSVSVRSMLERLDPDEYTELVRALAAELRGVPDLSDFTVGTDAGRAVGGEPGTGPGIGRVVPAVRTSDARHAHAVARFLQGRKFRAS